MDWERDLPDRDESLGPPVTELQLLQEPPATGFLGRIRGRINRRLLTADTLDLSLQGLFQTFFEYLSSMIQALVDPEGRRKEP